MAEYEPFDLRINVGGLVGELTYDRGDVNAILHANGYENLRFEDGAWLCDHEGAGLDLNAQAVLRAIFRKNLFKMLTRPK